MVEQKLVRELCDYWNIEEDVSHAFNRAKAKIFNLIEATITEDKKQEAVKGLIKGFINDEYYKCIEAMRFSASRAKLIDLSDMTAPAYGKIE